MDSFELNKIIAAVLMVALLVIGIGKISDLIESPKRVYVGAHRTNFNGALLQKSNVKASSIRFWFDHLSNELLSDEIKKGLRPSLPEELPEELKLLLTKMWSSRLERPSATYVLEELVKFSVLLSP